MIRTGVLVTCLAAVLALVSGCYVSAQVGSEPSAPGDATFRRDGFPITFRYPSTLVVDEQPQVGPSGSARPDDTVALVAGQKDAVLVQRYTLRRPVTPADLPSVTEEIDKLVGSLAGTTATGTPATLAGLPAITYGPLDVRTPEPLVSRVVVLFDGDREIFLNCQWTPGSTAVPQACDRMLATLERT